MNNFLFLYLNLSTNANYDYDHDLLGLLAELQVMRMPASGHAGGVDGGTN
jgi:hypothetical protein